MGIHPNTSVCISYLFGVVRQITLHLRYTYVVDFLLLKEKNTFLTAFIFAFLKLFCTISAVLSHNSFLPLLCLNSLEWQKMAYQLNLIVTFNIYHLEKNLPRVELFWYTSAIFCQMEERKKERKKERRI